VTVKTFKEFLFQINTVYLIHITLKELYVRLWPKLVVQSLSNY